jgi:hypothetical protein
MNLIHGSHPAENILYIVPVHGGDPSHKKDNLMHRHQTKDAPNTARGTVVRGLLRPGRMQGPILLRVFKKKNLKCWFSPS